MFKRSLLIILMLFLLSLCLGVVSASENMTDNIQGTDFDETVLMEENIEKDFSQVNESIIDNQKTTHIDVKNTVSYYKEKMTLVSYLKDSNNQSIQNKTIKIQINDKIYKRTTDKNGKLILSLNLKPNTYEVKLTFEGDGDYNSTAATSKIIIKKAPLNIKMSNYNTYFASGLFFKVKIYNEITKNAVGGIKVKFKVYNPRTKKYSYYWATTDKKGYAKLSKNLTVGKYKISAKIDDSKNKEYVSYKNSNKKVTVNVKPPKGEDCCSFFLQVSDSECVGGFRRDNLGAADIKVGTFKWAGKAAIKHYKTSGSYFVHLIVSSTGWVVGNGGLDDVPVIKSIMNMAEKMVKSNKIQGKYLKKILSYKRSIGFGHFSIKAPNGKYAVVWQSGYITGKLKPGEFSCSPNFRSYYRHSTYTKYSTNPVKAAIKVGATDRYGENRRDITVFHWKAKTNKNYKTTSMVKAYSANDNGKLVGRSSAHLKDNVYFKNKFFSKNRLPYSPRFIHIGTQKFGNIDKLIKKATIVSAPKVTNKFNKTQYFKVKVKDKSTKKVVRGIKIKVKLAAAKFNKYFIIKTDSKGIAKLNTKKLLNGKYRVAISPANNKYLISAKSTIFIR